MRNYLYIFSLFPTILTLIGNLSNNILVFSNLFYCLFLLVILDWVLPQNKANKYQLNSFIPDYILLLASVLMYANIGILIFQIYENNYHWYILVGAILSTGINSGVTGITVAHELIHRKSKFYRTIGLINLIFVNYIHFYIEHIKGHHKNVGTKADAATAYLNESIYHFYLRTIPNQFINAYKIEKNKNLSIIKNKFIQLISLEIIFLIYIYSQTNLLTLICFILQSIVAILLLEYVNYIEHYGLVRINNERYQTHHAWQSNHFTSRFTLIDLSRHSDHHLRERKPYHTLNSHESSPEYPSGYFGMFYICLIPNLWFKITNPIIKKLYDETY